MPIAFTPGEPSGIGPDIAIIYAQKEKKKIYWCIATQTF